METDKRYFLVGLFILLTGCAAAAFALWIAVADKGNTQLYRIRFAESVSGLTVGSSVKFRGVNIGTVETISIDPNDTRLIRVDVRIDESTPIKTDTIASLKPQGITGLVFVELLGGSPKAQDLARATPKHEIPEIPSQTSSISAIVNQLPELLGKVSQIADRINVLLNDENMASIRTILSNAESFSGDLATQSKRLESILTKGDNAMGDLAEVTQDTKRNVKEFLENMNESSYQLNETLLDIRRTSRNISQMTETLKDNPSSLIFPRREKGVPAP